MNYKKVVWGAILIISGLIILLSNLGLIQITWRSFFAIWPIIFVFIGISLLPVKEYIKIALAIATIAAGVVIMMTYQGKFVPDSDALEKERQEIRSHEGLDGMEEPFDSTIIQATLDLEASAGTFLLGGNTGKLFSYKNLGEHSAFTVLTHKNDSHAVVDVKLESDKLIESGKNKAAIELNPSIVWNIGFDAGAASVEADFSNLRIKNLHLDGGACSATLKFGMQEAVANISIDAAASSITIYVPREVSCEVHNETILTDNGYEGFTRIKRGHWKSENYTENAAKIIRIEIEAAVASVNVIRY
jgi:hypothetical protein